MRYPILLILFMYSINYSLTAQNTYVPDNNFEQRLIELGYDNVLDDYVLTANISGVQYLDVQYRSISDLTGLEDFESLIDFNCDGNSITNIPLHPSVNLGFLACQHNQLTTLNLSQHTLMFELACTNNDLTSLDLSQNINLQYIVIGGNQFAEIDLSNNTALVEVLVYGQNLALETVDMRNGNNTNISDFVIINSPNLPYIYVDDCNYSTTNWTNIDPNTIFIEEEGQTSCAPLGNIDFSLNSAFSIHPNPSNDILFLNNNHNLLIDKVFVVDISGKIIIELSYDFDMINLEKVETGIYFINIQTDSSIISKKVIKF